MGSLFSKKTGIVLLAAVLLLGGLIALLSYQMKQQFYNSLRSGVETEAEITLPKGAKAQGSAALSSFRRWAVRGRKASAEDWAAFEKIERQRAWAAQDRKAIVRIKRRMRREAGSGVAVE